MVIRIERASCESIESDKVFKRQGAYYTEVNTIEDIMGLRNEFGDLIFTKQRDVIIIYDDYIE